jgi:hypothetical protein
VLNTHIHVKSTEGILSEQQTNQESDEEEDKHEKPLLRNKNSARALNIRLHCDVLWRTSQRCFNKYEKLFRT